MNQKNKQVAAFSALLLILIAAFYYININTETIDTIFLTVATFLFAIFTGFFTSRQSVRHEDIRERISQFDGNLTSLYRSAGSIDPQLQNEIGAVVKEHYKSIIDTLQWDYHFTNKSNTITAIHNTLEKKLRGAALDDLGRAVLAQMEWSLRDLQRVRKDMVSLYMERIPTFQWILLFVLAGILVSTITTIPSYLAFFPAALKASFAISVVAILTLLYRLNSMKLFEGTIGLSSAKDAIGIIDGEK